MRRGVSRRAFLAGSGSAAALLAVGGWSAARARAIERALASAVHPIGTTLEATIVLAAGVGLSHACSGDRAGRRWCGPSWRHPSPSARTDGGPSPRSPISPTSTSSTRQSPGRVEFLDFLGDPFTAAARPHELLTTHVASSMVQRVNQVRVGPITGRPFDAAVSTGDNIDNQQTNELGWFFGVLDGTGVDPEQRLGRGRTKASRTTWSSTRRTGIPNRASIDDLKTLHGFPDFPACSTPQWSPFADASARRCRGTRPTATTTA